MLLGALLATGAARAAEPTSGGAEQNGSFGDPFTEPTVAGKTTSDKCVAEPGGVKDCKPAGNSVNVLPNGKVLYWNALEGTENVKASIVAEYGRVAANDQSRLLDLGGPSTGPSWTQPSPVDAGANPNGYSTPLVPGGNSETGNDGALFCADQNFLADGRVIATGGTSYYLDPELLGTGFGVSELEGLRATRIYDPRTNTWTQSGDTNIGRWYPTLVTLGNGRMMVASGVRKLIKPVYPDRPAESGANVRQTETYDPGSGKWTDNGAFAQRSLPLFARLHLLPDGNVYYNAAGQSFNPVGQSYDEALWNVAASYNPRAKRWKSLGVPGLEGDGSGFDRKAFAASLGDLGQRSVSDLSKLGIPGGGAGAVVPGFRGSTFSVMLPLKVDGKGRYTKADFLTAGGVLNPPSPGSYFATSDSRITTIDTAGAGAGEQMRTKPTGDLSRPRWYPSGQLLPTGEVIAFNGADRDEVDAPGTEFPIQQAELFDPKTRAWRPLASSRRPRTYHNTAALLPDGRVLIGGHAPITTLYTKGISLPGGFAPNDGRDPSFEVYSPPYMFRGDRPAITDAAGRPGYDTLQKIDVDVPAGEIESVVMVRNNSQTHVTDADQRNVELNILKREGNTVTVASPPNGNVAPPGPYMLFVNKRGDKGPIPSVSRQLFLR